MTASIRDINEGRRELRAKKVFAAILATAGPVDPDIPVDRGRIAQIIELGSKEELGDIGKTRAAADFRAQVMALQPEVVKDVRFMTVNHLLPYGIGFEKRVAAAVYFQEPTWLNRKKVSFFQGSVTGP